MTGIYSRPIYRKNLKFENIQNNLDKSSKVTEKSQILNKFIESVRNSKCKASDYINFLVHLNLGYNYSSIPCDLTSEQKEYMRYLCGNESRFFGVQNITRGQIKIWFILYQLENKSNFPDFKTFTDWIETQVNKEKLPSMDSEKYLNDIKKCKSYFNTISTVFESKIQLGKKGYKDSVYTLSSLRPFPDHSYIPAPGPRPSKNLTIEYESFDSNSFEPSLSLSNNSSKSSNNNRESPDSNYLNELEDNGSPTDSFNESDFYDTGSDSELSDSSDSGTDLDIPELPMLPPIPPKLAHKQKELLFKDVPLIQRNSFLFEERNYLMKKKELKNFHLKEESIKTIRESISEGLKILASSNLNIETKIKLGDNIIYFVMDTFLHLKSLLEINSNQYLKRFFISKYSNLESLLKVVPCSEIFLNEEMLGILLDTFLPYICRKELILPTANLIKTCVSLGYLNINLDFEFLLPKFEIFDNGKINPSSFLATDEIENVNKLLISYSNYAIIPHAFGGYVELTILAAIPTFNAFTEDFVKKTQEGYSVEHSHVGGIKIKSDGNCVITNFVYEYLKGENEKIINHPIYC